MRSGSCSNTGTPISRGLCAFASLATRDRGRRDARACSASTSAPLQRRLGQPEAPQFRRSLRFSLLVRLIDLFAGCGGMTLGFTRAGFTPVFAVENDPDAADTYELNFGSHVARA